ncbi:hypothetical protein EST38_g2206 [Candolleomyces aberdarensis]|uniref:CBM1 domain-containing protein n=1 Tax=Candolleomyces aberdarensis TaxID=2316362 RepID=A0A4Q2DW50_9AGAR|nr:hypothetical protein EST38_g2206 [Candolleomyces aberdarensis]
MIVILLSCAYLLAANVLLVSAQAATRWCDGLTGICLWRYHEENLDLGYGYIFPPTARNSTEFIGFLTAPASVGWIGSSLGGPMRNNTLIVGWVDGNKPVISARFTPTYSPPQVLTTGPKLTILGTSGANATHQRIIYRCENCTRWGTGVGSINLNGVHTFGFATHAAIKPLNPSVANSSLYQHTEASVHTLNTPDAVAAQYDILLAQLTNAPPLDPGSPTGTEPPGPTPTVPALCSGAPNSIYSLNTAEGWKAGVVLSRLSAPRAVVVDSRNNLIVLQRDIGITGHTLDANGCVTSTKIIIEDATFNHGLDVVGNKLYVSAPDLAWSWDYDPATMTVSNQRVLVKDMFNPGHITRSIHVSRKNPDYISVQVGSDGNLDLASLDPTLGRSQVRVFDMRGLPPGGASYTSTAYGKVFGHGLRNTVGIGEDKNGNVYVVENSLDDAHRVINGAQVDIHDDNPAEKVYPLGNPTSPNQTFFAGYPWCYTVWEPANITDMRLQVGDWFVQDPTGTYNEAWCNSNAVKPISILPPHAAPLDMKFGVRPGDDNLYIALHGSSARTVTLGYKVLAIPGRYLASGQWVPNADLIGTKTSSIDILYNRDEGQCRAGCFRPCGMAWSANGENLYVTSDTSGEIFLVKAPTASGTPTITSAPTATPTAPTPTTAPPTSAPPASTTNTAPQATQSSWGQCGGTGYSGPSLCPSGFLCRPKNVYYSQCVPLDWTGFRT